MACVKCEHCQSLYNGKAHDGIGYDFLPFLNI